MIPGIVASRLGGAGPPPAAFGWNPADKSANITLSSADKIATLTSTGSEGGSIRSVAGRGDTGDWYAEIVITGANALVGIGTAAASLADYPGLDANGYGYYDVNGFWYNNNSPYGSSSPYSPGNVIGIRLNAGQLRYYLNGVDQGVAGASVGTGPWFIMWGPGTVGAGTRSAELKTGSEGFAFAPSGVSAWDGSSVFVSPPYSSDLTIHFDAADASTISHSSGNVDSWTCKASGQVWSQTGANRPVLSAAIFTPRAVDFNVVSGNRKWLAGTGITIPVPNTTFIVAHLLSSGANTALGLYGGASSSFGQRFLIYVSGSSQKYLQQVVEVSPLQYTNSSQINTPAFFAALWRSPDTTMSNFVLERDRTVVTDTIVGTTSPSTMLLEFLGSNDASLPSAGQIAEVLSYDRVLDSTERTAVYDYLSAKWGTP